MKIAVISYSGNVGKTTIARHVLLPRIPGAVLVSIESVNAGEVEDHVIRGRQFAELQEYLQVVEDAIVDIGASNIEELLTLMRRYRGSHEDFDYFVIPTVPAHKQQRDTMATLAELSRLGVPAEKVRIVFNMVEERAEMERTFELLLSFLKQAPLARHSLDCALEVNEIYARINGMNTDLAAIAADSTDYKALIASTTEGARRIEFAQRLATRRLAIGVVPEHDACFAALALRANTATPCATESVEL